MDSLSRKVGLGHRPELSADLLAQPSAIDFCEVVAESCFVQKSTRAEARALSELWPVVPHGVKLSLGSADGLDDSRLGQLASLARELRAPMVSEHVALTRGGAREIGHLTQLPRTREAVRVLARNVARARRRLPDVPLLLENVAWTFRWPEDELDEATFYQEVTAATGCPLLLDVGNLYANAVNEGLDPESVLAAYPLERVAMLHVAGGVWEHGFYFDTHAHPIPPPVFALVAAALRRCPDLPVLLERDAGFDNFDNLLGELRALRALRPEERGRVAQPAAPLPLASDGRESVQAMMLARQCQVAALLTDLAQPTGALASAIGLPALQRARALLERKRVEDALPLLSRLRGRMSELHLIAQQAVRTSPRPSRGAGPADALRIASAAAAEPSLRDDALHDRLLLRARFSGPDQQGCLRPRRGPFLGSERLSGGTRLRALKAPGAFAAVHLSGSQPPERRKPWNAPSPSPQQ